MIQTKVARVVSPTELILAAGAEDGVEEGMEFVVFSLSDTVYDPETKEDLGQIEIVKARLVAAHVQDKITIARTKSKTERRVIDPMAMMARSLGVERYRYEVSEIVHEKMAIEKAEAVPLPDLVVRVGDLARNVTTAAGVRRKEVAVA